MYSMYALNCVIITRGAEHIALKTQSCDVQFSEEGKGFMGFDLFS